MTSVLEASNLEDFIASAMMSDRAFESHRESTVILGPDGTEVRLDETGGIQEAGLSEHEGFSFDFEHMDIPRRPPWRAGMSAQELDEQERKAFLDWRRSIAK